MFHLIQQAVLPTFTFEEVLENWHWIVSQLAESPRMRKRQMAVLDGTC